MKIEVVSDSFLMSQFRCCKCIDGKKAGKELVEHLKNTYKSSVVLQHKELNSTACPGKFFPFYDIIGDKTPPKKLISANDIIWELKNGRHKVEIDDVDKAVMCT